MAQQDATRQNSRPPTIEDLLSVCQRLNEEEAKYLLIGGFAMNYYGLTRTTEDIDLLIDPSADNISKIKISLSFLPDNAINEIALDDVSKYEVVRVADEIVIDLLKKACEITYEEADIEYFEFKGVRIPIADLSTMIKTKQSIREKDKQDLLFLMTILEEKEEDN
ncbi:MAG: hypothetical protein QME07_05225 [bacterium]|nr:hypothetical protein [bacterium]